MSSWRVGSAGPQALRSPSPAGGSGTTTSPVREAGPRCLMGRGARLPLLALHASTSYVTHATQVPLYPGARDVGPHSCGSAEGLTTVSRNRC